MIRSIQRFAMIAICSSLVLAATAVAARAEGLSKTDKAALKDAMRNLETLAQESRLARTHADSDGVQHFAEMTLREHDDMIKELKALADKFNFTFDADPTRPDVKDKRQLESLKGKEFDRVYMSEATRELEESLGNFKKGEQADNDEMRSWFKKNVQVIRHRAENAKELYRKVKDKDKDK